MSGERTINWKNLVLSSCVLLLIVWTVWRLDTILWTPAPVGCEGEVGVNIEQGMDFYSVAYLLEKEGLIRNVPDFRWAAWLMRVEHKIQSGFFLLPRGSTHREILKRIIEPGGVATKNVTIPEGLTVRHIAGIMQRELKLDSSEFVSLCEDSAFAAELNVPAERLEGYLFPSTYNFYHETNCASVIRKMTRQFFIEFDGNLQARLDSVGFTLHQAVTLASIIEGELMIDLEAGLVSAVYHNRLKRRMLLGADPTIQYIIPDGPRRLLNGDLQIDSPYNTYRYGGLPPGPINNPGLVALVAAVNPADVDYLFFVAKGDGSHYFNRTHEGHLRDKQKFQEIRRHVADQNQ